MALALRYRGLGCPPDSAIKPWYFAGTLSINVGDEFRVPPEGLVLGRGTDADARVASNGVARKHARLSWTRDGELVVEDLDSTNGTEVNGVAAHGHRLRIGDILTLARCFDFEVVAVK